MREFHFSNIESINIDEWKKFVLKHPNGNIFQTPEYFQAHLNLKCYSAHVLFAVNNNEILGLIVSVSMYSFSKLFKFLTSRSIIIGGPLVLNDDLYITELLIKEYCKNLDRDIIYSEFRNLFDTSQAKQVFIKNKAKYEEHLNIIIDVQKSGEELWKNVHTKRRNEIRKAEKEGVKVIEINDVNSFKESYSILKDVYKRARLPIPDYQYFYRFFEVLGDKKMLKLFGAFFNDKLIGVMYILVYKNIYYDWYAGSFMDYYQKNPNDILPWKIIQHARENGYISFDFGGAGKPNKSYGVREYKKKYGGKEVNFGRYKITHKPCLFLLGILLLKLYKKFKSVALI